VTNNLSYLEWARGAGDSSVRYNLYSSALPAPDALLADDLAAVSAAEWARRRADSDGWGNRAVRAALAQAYRWPDPDQILLTTGCSGAYIVAARALLAAGDHALIEWPTYQPFTAVLDQFGLSYSTFDRTQPYGALDFDQLRARRRPTTRLIVLTHLHNPTGAPLLAADVAALVELLDAWDAYAVIDQVFGDFIDPTPLALQHPRLITLNSLSKVYGLSSLRLGWILAAPSVVARLRPVHTLFENGASARAHAEASVVLDHYARYHRRALQVVTHNRRAVNDFYRQLLGEGHLATGWGVSSYGCTAFFQLSAERAAGNDAAALCAWAGQAGVQVVDGAFFGAADSVRVGFGGAPDAVRDGLATLAAALRDQATATPSARP
jgi:aspartate/methionine/tyrosine aminotransferase